MQEADAFQDVHGSMPKQRETSCNHMHTAKICSTPTAIPPNTSCKPRFCIKKPHELNNVTTKKFPGVQGKINLTNRLEVSSYDFLCHNENPPDKNPLLEHQEPQRQTVPRPPAAIQHPSAWSKDPWHGTSPHPRRSGASSVHSSHQLPARGVPQSLESSMGRPCWAKARRKQKVKVGPYV